MALAFGDAILRDMRFCGRVGLGAVFCALMLGGMGRAQSLPAVPDAPLLQGVPDEEKLAPLEAAKRDRMMQPGLDDLKHGENEAAYVALHSLLAVYPDDVHVLRYCAVAAMRSRHDVEALDLFRRALAQRPRQPWTLREAMILIEARVGHWDDFDRDVAALRSAKKVGMDHGLDDNNGFVIDQFDDGAGQVEGVIYPLQTGRYHMLYRFMLPEQAEMNAPAQASAQGNGSSSSARCNNPDFQPHMDVESEDVDQKEFAKAHPDKAAKGERSYTLVSFTSPCSQGLVKFYPDGEPAYETVRADVLKAALSGPKR
jgi:hypothetical protein